MNIRAWLVAMGSICVAWGVFGLFHRSYYNPKWGFYIDAGPYYKETSMIEIIVGIGIIVFAIKKYRNR